MSNRKFALLALALCLVLGVVAVQAAASPGADLTIPNGSDANSVAPAVPIGPPGTVFRFEQTFGETGVPYVADPDHLYAPVGLGVNAAGNLWVAEGDGSRVMQYAANGAFLLQIGTAGLTYLADETHFAGPTDVSLDNNGDVWVADNPAARVVKFDPAGNYLMQLGVTWEPGGDMAHFDRPIGVTFDSAGNIYVSDTGNHRVQIFDSNGVYSATIGVTAEPGSDNDHFNAPLRMTVDENDYLYVADLNNHRVQIFDAGHAYFATLGVSGEAGWDNDHFNEPRGVAVYGGYIYVADSANHRVQVFDRATLTYQDTLGSFGTGNYKFHLPRDVVVDPAGNLFVADTLNYRVQKYDSSLVYVHTYGLTGVPYVTDAFHYNQPTDVAVHTNGKIAIVEDYGRGQRLIVLDAGGAPLFAVGEAGVPGGDNAHFGEADAVAFDAAGKIYVTDCANHRVQIFTDAGVYASTLGSFGQGDYEFDCPRGVAFDSSGNLYVVDASNQRIQVFDSSLTYVATIGETGVPGDDNNHFRYPQDVAVDGDDNVYVADTDNQRVQKFDSSYAWLSTLGVTGEWGYDNDHLNVPMGLAVDAADNIYVSEYWNPRVQVFDADGAYLTTIGGAWGDLSSQFRHLRGLAVDAAGNVYVPDLVNHRVQKFAPGVPDWQQVNVNGFGERYAEGVLALEEFNGHLYAGTQTNWAMGQGARVYRSSDGLDWSATSEPGFGVFTDTVSAIIDLAVFNGRLYAAAGWGDIQGQIWRSADGENWEPVVEDGFGNGDNNAVTSLATFNGLLYAGTGNAVTGAQIWRSASGDSGDWTQVAPDEPGTQDTLQVTGFTIFQDKLYAAVEAEWEGPGPAQVWRSTNGSSWDTVVPDGFGDADNLSTGGFAIFHDYLYVGTRNHVSGAQLWRTADGLNWQPVFEDGFGNPDNYMLERLFVFAGQLYAGVDNGMTGLEMRRTPDGLDWEQVNLGGFGDSNNVATLWNNAVAVYQQQFYMGTWNPANGGEIWRFVLLEQRQHLPVVRN